MTCNHRCSADTEDWVDWLVHTVKQLLIHWGYLALAVGLMGESAGLPLPGETVLMYASFVAHDSEQLNIYLVILIGSASAIIGDNAGYLVGRASGKRLLDWLRHKFNLGDDIQVAKDQIHHHGAATIFWARYIFGLRTIAGPVAGVLRMDWKKFLTFNALGAVTWVTAISISGYIFAQSFQSLAGYIEKVSWAISAGLFTAGYLLWRRKKKHFREREGLSS